MIHVGLLHDEVRGGLNMQNNLDKQAIPVIDIDRYINKSVTFILENYSTIVERNRTISDRLRQLEVSDVQLQKDKNNSRFTSFKLPTNHYTTLSRYAVATLKECNTTDTLFVHPVATSKIEQSLQNPDWNPNFNWRETFCNEADKNINVYHNGEFTIDKTIITYLKDIPKVHYVSGVLNGVYMTSDGRTIQEDHHLMIDDMVLANKFCEVALYYIKRDFDQNYKENLETILFTDKLFI